VTDLPAAAAVGQPGVNDAGVSSPTAQIGARVDERPELALGAAFGGGLLLALIFKRLAR
jgi:hypothetical protein